ncbi:MAG: hypothetical protein KC635_11775, partial [Myxococcales bacterium]|nr:hypothetical protein [Myxococcales bacterium]
MNGGLGANARVATRGRWPGLFSAAIALSLFASGCGDSDATGSSTKDDTVADADGVAGDVAPDTSIPDSIVFDTLVDTASDGTGGGDADTSDPNRCLENPGAFLCPCVANDDCNSNFCVPSASGDQVCTVVCEEQCPAGLDCKAVFFPGQDPTFLCVDVRANLCRPCRRNTDCQGNFGQIG